MSSQDERQISLAIVPSCNLFEEHFGPIGVSPQQLADGEYRGTWIVHYAAALKDCGFRTTVVVPTRRRVGRVQGTVLDVDLVRASVAYRLVPPSMWRGPLRPLGSRLSSIGLDDRLSRHDIVYIQEYAYARYGYLLGRLEASERPVIGAHHGTSLRRLSERSQHRVLRSGFLTALTRTEEEVLLRARDRLDGGVRISRMPNWLGDVWFADDVPQAQVGTAVWFGRIDINVKGLRTLFAAARQLAREGVLHRLSVIGAGRDSAELERMVEADPFLRECVVLHGRIDDERELARLVPYRCT
jgi:glycosyltransferase involved in cell wall biosynthesis